MTTLPLIQTDARGVIADADLANVAEQVTGKRRLFVFFPGWLTGTKSAQTLGSEIAAGIASRVQDDSVFATVHWPSDSLLWLASYYKKEDLAASIGRPAGARIIETALIHGAPGMRVTIIGHSFGCIIASESLATLAARGEETGVPFDLVLLQGAMPHNSLETDHSFGWCQWRDPNVRITTSQLDLALKCWFPVAEFPEFHGDCAALGCAGPSEGTVKIYEKLKVVDLTAAQRANPLNDPFAGEHSNILLPEVFDLIAQ